MGRSRHSDTQRLLKLAPRMCAAAAYAVPVVALAQESPFQTGATGLVTELTAIATPFAILLVMGLGLAAMVGRMSWGWPVLALIGICILFGAEQIITWAQQLFGVPAG